MPSLESTVETTSLIATEIYKDKPEELLVSFSKVKTDKIKQGEVVGLIDTVLMVDEASSTEKTKSRGDKLEDLGHCLLETSGLFQNIQSNTKGNIHELDHTCEFNMSSYEFISGGTLKSRRVVGESKNYRDEKIDVNIIYKVGSVSRFQTFSLAMIFSRKGLTGTPLRAACGVAKTFRDKDDIIILVFNDEDYYLIKEYPFAFNLILYAKLRRYLDHNDYKIDYEVIRGHIERMKAENFFVDNQI